MARQKNMKRRRIILRNTYALLRTTGLDHVSLKMIADRSGISKSLLQSYYPHKNQLIVEIVLHFMTTVLKSLYEGDLAKISPYVRMKVFIYLILQLGIMDEGTARILDSALKDNVSLDKWCQLLNHWLEEENVKDELGSPRQVQTGLSFILYGGGSFYLKRNEFGLGAEEIANIMVKTFMATFLGYSNEETQNVLKEGHQIIGGIEIKQLFDRIDRMFNEEALAKKK